MKNIIWTIVIFSVLLSVLASGFNMFGQPLRDFKSVADLEHFLECDDTDSHVYLTVDDSGDVNFNTTIYCGAKAKQLQRRAELQGYRLNLELLSALEFQRYYGWRVESSHLICTAVIGNILFAIEPATDRIWPEAYIVWR